jgi:hypothetical protein
MLAHATLDQQSNQQSNGSNDGGDDGFFESFPAALFDFQLKTRRNLKRIFNTHTTISPQARPMPTDEKFFGSLAEDIFGESDDLLRGNCPIFAAKNWPVGVNSKIFAL